MCLWSVLSRHGDRVASVVQNITFSLLQWPCQDIPFMSFWIHISLASKRDPFPVDVIRPVCPIFPVYQCCLKSSWCCPYKSLYILDWWYLYRSILGLVMWRQLATRPDISFSVSLLAHFQANPGIEHWRAKIHVVGYIKNTLDYSLTYSWDFDISPTAFVDADYGGCKDTHQSTSRYVFTMAGGAVTWSSKQQATVALSTVEVEYVAMSRCAQQMLWMHSWLDEVKIKNSLPRLIKGDNHGAITLSMNTKDHSKVKHIDIWHHYLQNLYILVLSSSNKSYQWTILQIYLPNPCPEIITNDFWPCSTLIETSMYGGVLEYTRSRFQDR